MFGGHEVQGDVGRFHELLSHGGCYVGLSIQLSMWLVGSCEDNGLSWSLRWVDFEEQGVQNAVFIYAGLVRCRTIPCVAVVDFRKLGGKVEVSWGSKARRWARPHYPKASTNWNECMPHATPGFVFVVTQSPGNICNLAQSPCVRRGECMFKSGVVKTGRVVRKLPSAWKVY